MNNLNYEKVESFVLSLKSLRDRCALGLFLETACKTKDLVEIRVGDIGQDILIGRKEYSISKALFNNLKEYSSNREKKDYLFYSRQSKKISDRRIRQIVDKCTYENLFVSLSPEDLRRISLYNSNFSKGGNIRIIDLNQLKKIRNGIVNTRNRILFDLLVFGFKSSQICNFTVGDLTKSPIDAFLLREIKAYVLLNKLSKEDFLFKTRQGSHLTKVRIFQIITSLGHNLTPRILNDSGLFMELERGFLEERLRVLGVKTCKFDFFRRES